jgi:hypothetical protein
MACNQTEGTDPDRPEHEAAIVSSRGPDARIDQQDIRARNSAAGSAVRNGSAHKAGLPDQYYCK